MFMKTAVYTNVCATIKQFVAANSYERNYSASEICKQLKKPGEYSRNRKTLIRGSILKILKHFCTAYILMSFTLVSAPNRGVTYSLVFTKK